MSAIRSVADVTRVSGLSFLALFNWLRPMPFFLTMLLTPFLEMIFYAALGDELGVESRVFFLLGGSMLAASVPAVLGGAMALSGERFAGTLPAVTVAPLGMVRSFGARAFPYALAGVVSGVVTLLSGIVVLRVDLGVAQIAAALPLIAVGSLSSAYFGNFLGLFTLFTRNVYLLANIALSVLTICAALLVPAAALPGWVNDVSVVFPLRAATDGLRATAESLDLGELVRSCAVELLVTGGWAALFVGGLLLVKNRMRVHGRL